MSEQQAEYGTAIATAAPNAYDLIMQAVSDERCDPAKLRELLAVRREWRADEAAAAFNAAVVRFQQRCPIIAKGDRAEKNNYAALDRIWRAVRPLMEECGLAISWESVRPLNDVCILDGHLRHSQGHTEPLHYELPMPKPITSREGKMVQNVAQAMGSATTYAKRYATCAALGINTGTDDDGNGGGTGPELTAEQAANLSRLCEQTDTDPAKVAGWAGVQQLAHLPAARYNEAVTMLERKLRGGAK